ncbi:PAS domain-containing sensor histidine kinase [Nocardioides marmorisolisilvae]|uniref:histidine kinase n=1 Tax=Nocardioides marmorisolisilvae TaxID=1542737 RepID=A0A3N0DXQ9_9ACTN|nr:PAS domain-containing sensor histidine kinase [Nocardioides marmorisolisilvae]RNL80402.1 PAS domain-containing protein [Nocardioides marmorisolisilvae]
MDERDAGLWDALPDGVVIADGNGVVLLVNAGAREMLGDAAHVGADLAAAVPLQDQDAADWFSVVRPFEGLGTRSGVPEQSWLLPDGSEVLVTTRLLRSAPNGTVDRVALVLRSGRGRARLDRERSDLVATVAHELRSPLTGVKGFVTTLLSKWDRLNDEQKKLMLTTVSTDAERLSRLITELLDVARIDTGRLPLYRRELDATGVIERVIASVQTGTSRSVLLDAEDGEHPVFADPDKFVQVVTNLVDNAVRHGEGTVRVHLENTASGLRLTVDDQGEGIPEALRSRVFTKFWKHGVRGGSGLGMYIVNGLVRVHGGELRIGDAPGGGARITVDWPSADPRT